MRADALISVCGRYRWRLSRIWDDSLPSVCWIMLNPSTADAVHDDPTIRRCIAFSRRWGAGGLCVVNLFGLRASDPEELTWSHDPIGAANDDQLMAGVRFPCDEGRPPLHVVAAWGARGGLRGRAQHVIWLMSERGVQPMCLGLTAGGQPRHPLYVRADQPLVAMW